MITPSTNLNDYQQIELTTARTHQFRMPRQDTNFEKANTDLETRVVGESTLRPQTYPAQNMHM